MESDIRQQIKNLIQREVVVATGCTEPGAVALAAAKAREVLGCMPDSTELLLSKNVFKNAMGVGIPGTGMVGLPIAVAIALCSGDSSRLLEVLTVPDEEVEKAKRWLANNGESIRIGLKDRCDDKLYIECTCRKGDDSATAIIAKRHTNFIHISHGEHVLYSDDVSSLNPESNCCSEPKLSARIVYDYATTAPIEELEFINETVELNSNAAIEGLKGYGLNTGRILMENAGGDIVHTVIARTVAASDARMDGCTLPVYSNSGSGNQGIACTLPVYEYGKAKGCSDEQITRALVLSHLTSIYIKRGIGRLSALCGIVNASIGVSCGIAYLHGGSYEQLCYSTKNMINTLAGMVCDGAKPSCALKMSTGLYSAFVSAELALHDKVVDSCDGLSEKDVDFSIRNLGRLGHDGMDQTDDMVLDIMTHKQN
ncbi:MAG: serine dehydratase subunit alpha family protein [Bacteroidales bacterium]|nr:serine dehydratase subunit alpha family protein [Bacteroidales bacterium]